MKSSITCASSSIADAPVANQIGRSNSNALIINVSLQPDYVRHVLIRGGLFFMRPLPVFQVPNLKTSVATDQRDLALQFQGPAHVFGQHEPPLAIRDSVFGARMEVAQKNAAIPGRERAVTLGLGAHPRKFLGRHDEKKLMLGFGQNDELLAPVAAPAGRNGDSVFLVESVAEFAGEEFLGLRVFHTPADSCAISIHFPPLLTTFRTKGQYKLM